MRRTGTELTVERELEDDLGIRRRYRLTARFDVAPGEAAASPEEEGRLLTSLSGELEAALAAGPGRDLARRPDRPVAELVEAYHPRQLELVDLLQGEGEITVGEAARLREFLSGSAPPTPPPPPAGVPPTEAPLAAAPLAQDRTPSVARSVDELIRLYRIESLKQAGAVRARRQISFEEYMALKRHFSAAEAAVGSPSAP